MDTNVQRLLNDKLYDKRKHGALEYVIPRSAPICAAVGRLYSHPTTGSNGSSESLLQPRTTIGSLLSSTSSAMNTHTPFTNRMPATAA